MPNTLLLIDDHALFRSGVALLLSGGVPNAVIHEAGSLDEALRLTHCTPSLILLDVQLQGVSGLEGITLLKQKWPNCTIVMVSAFDMIDMVEEARVRGALSFISKAEKPERMLEQVRQVLGGHTVPPKSEPAAGSRVHLTARQVEVLDLLSQGLSNKSIGRRLDLSENTVRGHVQAILSALSVSGRVEAAFAARRLGIIR